MFDSTSYQASLRLITRDLELALEFVEPVDQNTLAYSHRFFELYLRACTDFESVCRDYLVHMGSTIVPAKMDMKDYREISAMLKLESVTARANFWRPARKDLRPFAGWGSGLDSPVWYKDHHTVKHNRQAEFPVANLGNVVIAVGGLVSLLVRIDYSAFSEYSYGSTVIPPNTLAECFSWRLFSVYWPLAP